MTHEKFPFAFAAGVLWIASTAACSDDSASSAPNTVPDAGADSATLQDAASDSASDATQDAQAPIDAGDARWFRFVHPMSNLGTAIEICVRPKSGEPPLPAPLTEGQFPDGLPYGAATEFIAIGPELTTEQRAYFDVHRAPIEQCPDFSGLSDAPPSFVAFGMVLFNNPSLRWFTSGPVGLIASPPGEAVALCGPNFDEPCTSQNSGVSWFWAAEDGAAGTDATKADVALLSTLAGSLFATVCWDPDGAGSAPAVRISDLEQDGIVTDHFAFEPLTSGRVFVLDGGGGDCTSNAAPIAELGLPAASPPAGASTTIPAGSSGRLWLTGQVTSVPSSPAAAAKIVLLPGAPL